MQAVTAQGATLRGSTLTREVLVASGGAAILSALLVWMGPPGSDLAAHLYQRAVFLQHGFALWNNFWYAGRYSFITYSLIYYPLAAWIGIRLLAVATISAASLAFAVVVLRQWGVEGALVEPDVRRRLGRDGADRRVPVRARRRRSRCSRSSRCSDGTCGGSRCSRC